MELRSRKKQQLFTTSAQQNLRAATSHGGLPFSLTPGILKMKINTTGVTRIVIELKTVVIKIPNFTYRWSHFLRGIIANISESQTWKYNSGKYELGKSHLLCPVVYCAMGGWFLIMKKAQKINKADWQKMDITEHVKYFKGDDTHQNYGTINRKLVKLDYADLDTMWGEDFER